MYFKSYNLYQMKMRLEKFMASQNFGSRSEVKKIIKSGDVFVDNQQILDPAFKVDPNQNKISFNNEIIEYKKFLYIALNKPKNYVCASKDNLHSTVLDLVEQYQNFDLHIVGRLDKDTTGLVLLTNDGVWSHKLKSPKSNTEKEYEVTLEKPLDKLMIEKIQSKLILDNKILKPIKFKQTEANKCNVILTEGKYHQVKRMFHLIGNEVTELNRIRIGNFQLKDFNLKPGKWKEINIDLFN